MVFCPRCSRISGVALDIIVIENCPCSRREVPRRFGRRACRTRGGVDGDDAFSGRHPEDTADACGQRRLPTPPFPDTKAMTYCLRMWPDSFAEFAESGVPPGIPRDGCQRHSVDGFAPSAARRNLSGSATMSEMRSVPETESGRAAVVRPGPARDTDGLGSVVRSGAFQSSSPDDLSGEPVLMSRQIAHLARTADSMVPVDPGPTIIRIVRRR